MSDADNEAEESTAEHTLQCEHAAFLRETAHLPVRECPIVPCRLCGELWPDCTMDYSNWPQVAVCRRCGEYRQGREE